MRKHHEGGELPNRRSKLITTAKFMGGVLLAGGAVGVFLGAGEIGGGLYIKHAVCTPPVAPSCAIAWPDYFRFGAEITAGSACVAVGGGLILTLATSAARRPSPSDFDITPCYTISEFDPHTGAESTPDFSVADLAFMRADPREWARRMEYLPPAMHEPTGSELTT